MWSGVVTRSKPKKGGRVSSNTEDIPERVDTGIEGSNNTQALCCSHPRWKRMGAKCHTDDTS